MENNIILFKGTEQEINLHTSAKTKIKKILSELKRNKRDCSEMLKIPLKDEEAEIFLSEKEHYEEHINIITDFLKNN